MSSHLLQRIESGSFDQLPGGLLTRGYLRAFAREVGLDPEEIVNEYRAEYEATVEDAPFSLPRSVYHETETRSTGPALAVVIALAIIMYVAARPPETPSAIPVDAVLTAINVDTTPSVEPAAAPVLTDYLSGPPSLAAVDWEGVQIQLQPQTECWVSATADGRSVIYRLMQPGEQETIHAREEVVLRVGDAGALEYVVNGRAGRVLGASGEPVTVRITSDNAHTWVTDEPAQPDPSTPERIARAHDVGV
jgi:cytoskeletal protein RodZ